MATGSSSLSTDKINLPSIVEANVTDFKSKSDDAWSSFQSLADAANGSISGITDKINSTINGAVGSINSYINGFESQAHNILDSYIPKNLSFNTNQLGFFENILCGKLPSLDIRLPRLDLDFGFWKSLDASWDITICGKSEVFNPLDTALSMVNKLKNYNNPIDGLKYDLLNKLINTQVGDILNTMGLSGTPSCLLNDIMLDSKWFGENTSLNDRISISRYLTGTDCLSQALRGISDNNVISNAIYSKLIGNATGAERWFLDKVFDYVSDKGNDYVSKALSNTFLTQTGSTSNKFSILIDRYGTNDGFSNIISTNTPKYEYAYDWENSNNVETIKKLGLTVTPTEVIEIPSNSLGQRDSISVNELLNLRTDGETVLKNIVEDDKFTKDPINTGHNVISGLNLLDPTWMYDNEGNKSLYKTKDNEAMTSLSNHYLNNITDNEINLTGNVVTRLNVMHEIAIVNSFA